MESRIDGIMELWIGRVGSRLIAQSHSLLSLTSIPFRLLSLVFRQRSVSEAGQQVYKTTKQLVGRQPVGFAGITDCRNYGTTKRVSRLTAHSSMLTAHSPITLYTLSTFYTL